MLHIVFRSLGMNALLLGINWYSLNHSAVFALIARFFGRRMLRGSLGRAWGTPRRRQMLGMPSTRRDTRLIFGITGAETHLFWLRPILWNCAVRYDCPPLIVNNV